LCAAGAASDTRRHSLVAGIDVSQIKLLTKPKWQKRIPTLRFDWEIIGIQKKSGLQMSVDSETKKIEKGSVSPPAALTLLDSAMAIALFTGICYFLGYIDYTNNSVSPWIPWHLRPVVDVYVHMLVGCVYLLMYFGVVIVVMMTDALITKGGWENNPRGGPLLSILLHRFEKKPVLTMLLLVWTLLAVILLVPQYGGRYVAGLRPFQKFFLRVSHASLTDGEKFPSGDWRYISTGNGHMYFASAESLSLANDSERELLAVKSDSLISL
jgi:hypothetical protein